MSVRFRLLAGLLPLVVAPLAVVATPQAAHAYTGIKALSSVVAVLPADPTTGHHAAYVWAHCYGSRNCSGRAALKGQSRDYYTWKYSIKAGTSDYIKVWWLGDADNEQPTGLGPAPGTDGVTFERPFVLDQSSGPTVSRTVTLERRQQTRRIAGHIDGPTTGVSDLKVTSWAVSGLVSRRVSTVDVGADRAYSFTSSLGTNNSPGNAYRLSVSAMVDGERREWFYRGSNGQSTGGGKTVSESHSVHVEKMSDFIADFNYGTIHGTLSGAGGAGADVRVVAPPRSRPSTPEGLRGLDVPYCANELGATTASSGGGYEVRFLPRSAYSKYLVAVNPSGSQTNGTFGDSGTVWASCHAATKYTYDTSDDDLIALGAGNLDVTQNANLDSGKRRIGFDTDPAYSGYTYHDTWTSLREYVPGTKILDRPILQAGHASSTGQKQFEDVRPGRYWVEAGRRVGCSAWYPSVYHNNDAYLEGADRGNEAWKTVDGKYPEYNTSYTYGYVAKTPPKGYVGWMYRDVCRSMSAGDYQLVNAMELGVDAVGSNVSKLKLGATISGHVSRAGGKSNKEMMVSAYSTQGVLVMRSAYTNSKGDFKIRGLASGNYRIVVNGDSWRGITRSFDGTKTKRVTAGHGYSVGTLHLNG